jgi:ribosomal protein S18 acetylase RimI-like enzyme
VSAIAVRRAVEGDAAAIAAVHVRAWQAAYRGLVADEILDGSRIEGRERMWNELLAGGRDAPATTVAEVDGAVAGFCTVAAPSRDDDAPPRTAEIPAIYVDPDHLRRGIGAALLGAALDGLEQGGWERVTLWVFAGNDAARAFYARFGFEPDGTSRLMEAFGASVDRLVRPAAPSASRRRGHIKSSCVTART